ncbi:Tetratricopeptide repeat protein 38 [Toxocara canis]|uniref:Tetratricopeptide repeat protein 38 n=1 Tax=Toxocara canis TaxID=6265 RepID=A0A0B2VV54_TOXCA|nr:Tetratricopeptide repeat protein 38 [Toxocara canis]
MSRVLTLGLEAMGTARSVALDEAYRNDIEQLVKDANASGNEREKMHARAISLFANGGMTAACQQWERILRETPNDLLAIKFAHDAYFYLGDRTSIRDSISRVLPHWNTSAPCYSYLHGMYAFGLEECEEYEKAEKEALKGLELRREDAWATHALVHCMEMNGRVDEGIKFMETTVQDWSPCFMLACHNYWHTALLYLEKQNYETVLSYYDSEIASRSKSGAMLDLVDAASILFRLHIEGVDVGERWNALLPVAEAHIDDHILAFNDAHFRMIFDHCRMNELSDQHRNSVQNFITSASGDNCRITRQIGEATFDAISSYCRGDFKRVIERLTPLRRKLFEIGGSNAQRDLFTQILIQSCLRSPVSSDHKLARILIEERNSIKKNSSISKRLMEQFNLLSKMDEK